MYWRFIKVTHEMCLQYFQSIHYYCISFWISIYWQGVRKKRTRLNGKRINYHYELTCYSPFTIVWNLFQPFNSSLLYPPPPIRKLYSSIVGMPSFNYFSCLGAIIEEFSLLLLFIILFEIQADFYCGILSRIWLKCLWWVLMDVIFFKMYDSVIL